MRRQLDDQHKRQEQRMQDVKATLKSEFKDGKLQERLQEVAATIVREIVRKEVAQRVRKQVQQSCLDLNDSNYMANDIREATRTGHSGYERTGYSVSTTNSRSQVMSSQLVGYVFLFLSKNFKPCFAARQGGITALSAQIPWKSRSYPSYDHYLRRLFPQLLFLVIPSSHLPLLLTLLGPLPHLHGSLCP